MGGFYTPNLFPPVPPQLTNGQAIQNALNAQYPNGADSHITTGPDFSAPPQSGPNPYEPQTSNANASPLDIASNNLTSIGTGLKSMFDKATSGNSLLQAASGTDKLLSFFTGFSFGRVITIVLGLILLGVGLVGLKSVQNIVVDVAGKAADVAAVS